MLCLPPRPSPNPLRLVKLAAGDGRHVLRDPSAQGRGRRDGCQGSAPLLRLCHPLSPIIRPVDASGKQGETRSGGSEATGESGRARKRASFWRRHDRKSFLFLIWAGIAVASLGFVLITAWISLQSRSRTLDAATGSIENLALVLEKLLLRKVDSIETLLHAALHEGRRLQAEPGAQPSTSLLAELAQDVPLCEDGQAHRRGRRPNPVQSPRYRRGRRRHRPRRRPGLPRRAESAIFTSADPGATGPAGDG